MTSRTFFKAMLAKFGEQKVSWVGLSLLLLLFVLLHSWRWEALGVLGRDDWEEALVAQFWAWGYHPSNPPLHSWLLRGLLERFAGSALVFPGLHFGLMALSHLCLFGAARLSGLSGLWAWFASLGLVFWPVWGWDSLTLYTHSMAAIACAVASLWAWEGLKAHKRGAWLAFVLALALGLLAKYGLVLLFLAYGVAAFHRSLRPQRWRVLIGLGGAILLAGPVLAVQPGTESLLQSLSSPTETAFLSTLSPFAGADRSLEALANLLLLPFGLCLGLFAATQRATGWSVQSPQPLELSRWRALIAFFQAGPHKDHGLMLILGLGLLISLGLLGLFPRIATHHALPLLPLFALWLAHFWQNRLCDARKSLFAKSAVAVCLGLMTMGGLVTAGQKAVMCHGFNQCKAWPPQQDIAQAVQDLGFTDGLLLAETVALGGGLRPWLSWDRIQIMVPSYDVPWERLQSVSSRESQPCLLLWRLSALDFGAQIPGSLRPFWQGEGDPDPQAGTKILRSPSGAVRLGWRFSPSGQACSSARKKALGLDVFEK